jgi:hypothetical protein
MIKVEPILYKSKVLSNGEHPVMIRLTQNGKRKYFSVGVSCKQSQWNEKSNLPNTKHPLYKELQILITQKVNDIRKEIYVHESKNSNVEIDSIKKRFGNKEINQNMAEFIDILVE